MHLEVLRQIEQHRIDEFFRFIKEHLQYRFKGITTDLDEMLEKSVENELCPIEVCGVVFKYKDWLKNAVDFY